jgi:hypothetical protein
LPLDLVIVPALQGLFRDADERRDVGDVTEADQTRGLLQEAFGGMGSGGEYGRNRGEEGLASGTPILIGADDEFNGLRAKGEVAHGAGFRAALDGITAVVTRRTDAQRDGGEEGQPDRIGRCALVKMDDLEAIQVKQLGPEVEVRLLVHSQDSQSVDWAMAPLLGML